jgi:hypothetical protein
MTLKLDSPRSDLSRAARIRVRLPDAMTPSCVFAGWGPTV